MVLFSLFLFVALASNIAFVNMIRNSGLATKTQNLIIKAFLYCGMVFTVLALYAYIFKFSPRYKIKFRSIIPGVVVASIPTIVFILVFGLIVRYLSYKRYGYIGTFLYIGLLVLTISYFMFVGLIVNVAYYQTFIDKKLEPKKHLWHRKAK